MFYSTITPNVLAGLFTAAGYTALGLLLIGVVFAAFSAFILQMGLLALGRSNHPVADTLSIDELEALFEKDAYSAEERARAAHPAGRNRKTQN
jgi:hypothetical protein